ncbi:MAG: molybdopterin-guanine dinucleotide biosynthesis protein B [Pseudomonadota bacterium]
MIQYPIPFIGICAYSGTGKTTLLTSLIPLLEQHGLRIGVIKHAHHNFEIDHKEKDSYKIRQAGARQMLIASDNCIAKITPRNQQPVTLEEALQQLDQENLDLVLVEGFKKYHFPKIELHRSATNNPYIYTHDSSVIALACDLEPELNPRNIPILDLNDVEQISQFIIQNLQCLSQIKHINYT